MSPIVCERHGKAGRIRLSCPQTTNAMSRRTFDAILDAFDSFEHDAAEIIVIDHVGEPGFSVGGDAIGLAESGRKDGREAREYFEHQARVNRRIHHSVKPVVTIVDGPAIGGGIGLFLSARHRVVTDRAMVAFMEAAVGMVPDVGASWFLPRLPGATGMWLALTGAKVVGADFLRRGLADVYVRADDLPAFVSTLEDGLAALPAATSTPYADEAIDAVFGQPTLHEILAAIEARAEDVSVARQLAALRRASPSALVETFNLIRRGAALGSFDEALAAEIECNSRLVCGHDWLSFARASLIEKDRPASHDPATVEAALERTESASA